MGGEGFDEDEDEDVLGEGVGSFAGVVGFREARDMIQQGMAFMGFWVIRIYAKRFLLELPESTSAESDWSGSDLADDSEEQGDVIATSFGKGVWGGLGEAAREFMMGLGK